MPRKWKAPAAAAPPRSNAILSAALEEFIRHGFAAARVEDIARRASVAKGTVYLYFRDKQALFEALVRRGISPILEAAREPLAPSESVRAFLERTLLPAVRRPGSNRRAAILRLLIAESGRFPKLAEMYFGTVVQSAMKIFRQLAARAYEHGELANRAAVEFPQLVVAPLLVAFLWSEFFQRLQPLNPEAMLEAHLDNLFQPPAKRHVRQR